MSALSRAALVSTSIAFGLALGTAATAQAAPAVDAPTGNRVVRTQDDVTSVVRTRKGTDIEAVVRTRKGEDMPAAGRGVVRTQDDATAVVRTRKGMDIADVVRTRKGVVVSVVRTRNTKSMYDLGLLG